MARSPFQGTFQPNVRPTVVTSPDALVYINGESNVIGCPSCQRKFDFHRYITSIQVDLSIDSVPGSASVSLVVPRHAIDDFLHDGVPVISPMMEIEIYAKGYFLVEGVPQYYPIFWGLVTEVSDAYSGGQHTISINCSDILKWWELCKMNINPAFTNTTTTQNAWNLFGNVYSGKNPYDVMLSLAQESMGDVVVGTGSLTSYNGEQAQKSTFSAALSDLSLYWQSRFSRMRSNLLLYGTQGVAVRGDTLYEQYVSARDTKGLDYNRAKSAKQRGWSAASTVRNANGGKYGGQMVFDTTADNVTAFKTQFNNAGQVNFWQSEFQTKLEIANLCKEAIGFEFYMDVTGDLVFKPPFYNLDTLPNKPVSWIQDIDIIDWSFSESEAEVVTQVQMAGSFGGNVDFGFPPDVEPFTSVTDYHLLRKYGWRSHQVNSEFLGDPMLMFYHGLDIMDRLNSRRHRGTVSIPLRPELRLGFPIYVAPKDQMWYVSGISHQIQFGGSAQTTLTLTARRTKFFAPRGIGRLELTGFDPKAVQETQGAVSKPLELDVNGTGEKRLAYSSRQLAKGGLFKIKLGEAASIPVATKGPNPGKELDQKLSDPESPYRPLVFRHPKTGRSCGFPNVVMAYTRPFAVSKDNDPEIDPQTGTQGKQRKLTKQDNKELEKRSKEIANQVKYNTEVTEDDALRIKYMQNRYMYGLNSAGVFVYLYDAGGQSVDHCVDEVLLLPSSRIKLEDPSSIFTNNAGKKVEATAKYSGLIRPVSDSRGFEHIGHFRYGRNVALRDGRLVGETQSTATVAYQTALSGDLSAQLMAQSQGLTTITTTYPNPAANLATMLPEDMQTGAVYNPETKEATFSNATPPFISSQALGSTETNKLQPVEATQLSKALTLAEMTVKYQDGSSEPCGCILSRPDLTFLFTGTKVKSNTAGTPAVPTNFLIGDANEIDFAKPVETSKAFPSKSIEDVAQSVDTFLYNLYKALDEPHQVWEKAIRGENTPQVSRESLLSGPPSSPTYGQLSPPYNAAQRYSLGDPDAILGAIESNANSLEQAWEDFQTDLKTKPYIAALERYISQLDSRIANAQQQLASLDPTVPGYAQTKKELEKELEINQERRDKAQMYLGQLQNGGSVTPSIEAFVESILTNEGNDVTDQTVEVVAYGNATDT